MSVDRHRRTNGHTPGVLDRAREEADFFWSDISEIRGDLQQLAAKETELLKAEVDEQKSILIRTLSFGATALALGFIFDAFVFVTLLFVLDSWMDTWLAALITTLVLGAITALAGFLAYRAFKQFSPVPRRTIESLKEDMQWARDLMTSTKR
jgi:uncharacterized membrane protein YqjE